MDAQQVTDYRLALQAELHGYQQPHAYGVGVLDGAGATFPVVNNGSEHRLPAVVLAAVLGYRSGTCTLAMTGDDLRAAYELLLPVEPCTAWTHPNLWAWRELLRVAPEAPFCAVFIVGPDAQPCDAAQAAFLALPDNTD